MKRYSEMTMAELAKLEDESEIKKLIDLEIAYAGIKPVRCPEIPAYHETNLNKDVQVFEVNGWYFVTREEAEQVAQTNVYREDYDWNISYDYKWIEPVKEIKVSTKRVYDESKVRMLSETLVENERRKKEYEKLKEQYDKFLKKTKEIRAAVWEKVNNAMAFMQAVEDAKATYEKYLNFADNDEKMATKFFVAAYKNDPEILAEVAVEKGITLDSNVVE